MKKILFFIESLGGGGAEKVLFDIIKSLDKTKYEITVKTITDIGIYNKEIKKYCNYESFLSKNLLNKNIIFKLIYKVKYHLIYKLDAKIAYKVLIKKKYDIEIAFIEGYATKIIGASSNKKSKKICWIHFIPNMYGEDYADKAYKSLKDHIETYKVFNKIVCVSKSIYDIARDKYNISEKNLIVKYNPIDSKNINLKANYIYNKDVNNKITLITIGRLVYEKGYDRLLRVVKRLKEDTHIDFELLILGDGEQRDILEKYIKENNLINTVKLLGFVDNPYKYVKKSDLFICSSRTEGYSLAIAEALVLGVPVISTDCNGPNEILSNGKYGLIVDNSEKGLYEGIKLVLSNRKIFYKLKNKSIERGKNFDYKRIIYEIENEILCI